jgi:hypothetical protein
MTASPNLDVRFPEFQKSGQGRRGKSAPALRDTYSSTGQQCLRHRTVGTYRYLSRWFDGPRPQARRTRGAGGEARD